MATKTSTKARNEQVTLIGGKAIEVPAGYKIGRRMTVPLKLINEGEKFAFRPESEIVQGDESGKRKGFDKGMTVVPVIDLETGENLTLICNTVLESALKRVPGGYVGKDLLAMRGGKATGKRYSQFELFEIEKADTKEV